MQSEIKQVTFKSGLPLEIEIIPIAATVAKHHNSITVPHRATFYHIFWIQKGTAEYLIDFEPVKAEANSFLFVNKDRVKAIDNRSKHDGKIMLFTDDFFGKTEDDLKYLHSTTLFNDLLNTPVINVNSSPSLQTAFSAIETELTENNDTYHYHLLHNLLHNLLLLAERERRKQGFSEISKGADLDYTVLFRDLLDSKFKILKSVTGYAALMNVSEKRLTHATTKTLGKSPKIIIDERVMLEAKRLLIYTNRSIKEVGYDLGFEEPTNFIKYFRKHTDNTPIEFREAYFNR
ncbi:AraC-like DNA-binding protein [Arcticibacter tournemirensis]|uniref:AraC family transcriptional regulator n=1 Tax=Arcticibacter tournemirensis TaxID=699437 RepID=A0A5M9H928_9SPHI|nr:helix-turn-helix domain-containing protein [Arcticibacter tournemirensis]KAA8483436.1 AraC family transcriptional regulator [Arcticibacter tournemirensis]TQM50869.1 AraC-like DNA-binding protein [Arcticibacter tournemirensis]